MISLKILIDLAVSALLIMNYIIIELRKYISNFDLNSKQ